MSLYTLKYKETREADREILSVASIVSIMYVHTPGVGDIHTCLKHSGDSLLNKVLKKLSETKC